MKGDILVENIEKNLVSRAIGWFSKSSYCHCAICISDTQIVEATFTGVKISPLSNYNNYKLLRVKEITQEQIDKAVDFALKQVGDFYDFGSIAYLGLQYLFNNKDNVNKWDSDNRWFCSELVSESFIQSGIDLCPGLSPDETSPGDIDKSELLVTV